MERQCGWLLKGKFSLCVAVEISECCCVKLFLKVTVCLAAISSPCLRFYNTDVCTKYCRIAVDVHIL